MFTYKAQHQRPAALAWHSAFMQIGIRFLDVAAERWRTWLVERRMAKATLHDFRTMSGRELHDIGLTRTDVPCVGWDALTDFRNRI
jgi:uncharacterized protein YjiS (DUF1127 family)